MKLSRIVLGLAIAGLSFSANATNGYFGHGYGMKAKGMAGAATTNTDDTFFGANNPAAAAFAGNRIDLGVDLFNPVREYSVGAGGVTVFSQESGENYHLIPEFGYNRMVNDKLALGVSVYGNGGMNTKYDEVAPGANFFGAPGALGVDLMQLIVAPTAAYKVAPNHSIGISPLLGYQMFKADGLGGPTSEHDDAFGYGVRVGYLGQVTPTVTIGAAYASKMRFEEFDKYNWLYAEYGDFDIPENYNVGVSWQATTALRLALDYQRINYSGVKSISNPVMSMGLPGAPDAAGFGWDDVDVWKLGAEYKYNKQWTFRAGYSHSNSPIEGATALECGAGSENCMETFLNLLAPGVVEDHITLGFTYTLASGNELTVAYMHALENDVTGAAFDSSMTYLGDVTNSMYQNSLGIQYSWKM